jgi:hypothetical protein
MHRSKYVAFGFLTGALLVGTALGYAADRMIVQPRLCVQAPANERDWRRVVYEDLALNQQQRAAWDSLLDERRRALSAANATIRPRLDSIQENYRRDFQELLSPDQRARFAKRQQEMQQRERERRAREQEARERARGDKDTK